MTLTATIDSVSYKDRYLRATTFTLAGPLDSLDWSLAGDNGGVVKFAGAGRGWLRDQVRSIAIDSLALGLPTRDWRLLAPTTIAIGDSTVLIVPPFQIAGTDGSGFFSMSGKVPWKGEETWRSRGSGSPCAISTRWRSSTPWAPGDGSASGCT